MRKRQPDTTKLCSAWREAMKNTFGDIKVRLRVTIGDDPVVGKRHNKCGDAQDFSHHNHTYHRRHFRKKAYDAIDPSSGNGDIKIHMIFQKPAIQRVTMQSLPLRLLP